MKTGIVTDPKASCIVRKKRSITRSNMVVLQQSTAQADERGNRPWPLRESMSCGMMTFVSIAYLPPSAESPGAICCRLTCN